MKRFRLSTLMLLIVILALAFALVFPSIRAVRERRRLEAEFRAARWAL